MKTSVLIDHLTIESDEGLPIRAALHVPEKARGLVFVLHGFKGFKEWGFFPWISEQFAGMRLAVCRFDMSRNGVGESGDTFDRLDLFAGDTYSIELADLARVVDSVTAIPELHELPVFLFGHSRGGGIAILGAERVPRLAGVVAWAPIAYADRWDDATKALWRRNGYLEFMNARTKQAMRSSAAVLDDLEKNRERLDIVAAAARLAVPLLVVHGGADESVPPEEGQLLASRARNASFVMIEGASHTFGGIHPLVNIPLALRIAAHGTGRFIRAHC
ncbi:MAG: alpha/beta hydrolase family protein [Thermoanaerobaculia bacterium]